MVEAMPFLHGRPHDAHIWTHHLGPVGHLQDRSHPWKLSLSENMRNSNDVLWKCRVPQDCPQGIVDLYLACLSTDPKARPTAEAMMEEIAALMPRSGQNLAETISVPAQ